MKPNKIFLSLLVISLIYTGCIVYLTIVQGLPYHTLLQCFFVFCSMMAVAFICKGKLTIYHKSVLIPLAVYFAAEIAFPLFLSISKRENELFSNSGWLSHTEVYFLFVVVIYNLYKRQTEKSS